MTDEEFIKHLKAENEYLIAQNHYLQIKVEKLEARSQCALEESENRKKTIDHLSTELGRLKRKLKRVMA